MKTVQLTRGYATAIDENDAHILGKYRWSAMVLRNGYTYARRGTTVQGKPRCLLLHREIMGVTDPSVLVDHINGDTLDNRRQNLRIASKSQNSQNQITKAEGTSSRFKGVYWWKTRSAWRAVIKLDGKPIFLGKFQNEEDAARAYDSAAIRMFGEYARPNFLQVPRT